MLNPLYARTNLRSSSHRPPYRRRPTPRPAGFSRRHFRLRPRLEIVEDRTLLSTFLVNTTADNGPGSLRQAILDSNAASSATRIIDFAIPGQGVQVIATDSPLPPITTGVLIDGTSQPGYAGSPLVAISGRSAGDLGSLTINDSSVTVRGIALEGLAVGASHRMDVVSLQSGPFPHTSSNPSSGNVDVYRLDVATAGLFAAMIQSQGVTTELTLLDAQGNVVVRSDGISQSNPNDLIDEYLAAGTYSLKVEGLGGVGAYVLTTTLTPAAAPFQPAAVGSLGATGILPSPHQAVVAGDFTGDGRLDLAVVTYQPNPTVFPYTGVASVAVLLGNSDGTFQPPEDYAVGDGSPQAIVTGDFNGDGHLDLAIATEAIDPNGITIPGPGNQLLVMLGRGDGTFQPPVSYSVGDGIPQGLVVGQFTGDGHVDLAVALENTAQLNFVPPPGNPAGTVAVFLGNGDGTFQPAQQYAVAGIPGAITTGDFNGDGHLDIATANIPFDYYLGALSGSITVSVLLGNGNGTFQPQVQSVFYAPRAGLPIDYDVPLAMASGDWNGDGHLDLAIASVDDDAGDFLVPDTGLVFVLMGVGDGTFRQTQAYALSAGLPQSLTVGDFDGDGLPDLAVATDDSALTGFAAGSLWVLLGKKDGTLQPVQNAVADDPIGLASGDFDGDGRVDLATVNRTAIASKQVSVSVPVDVSVHLGLGNGTFENQVPDAVGEDPVALVAGDFNGDGRLDLATADLGSQDVSVLLGNRDGTFQPAVRYSISNLLEQILHQRVSVSPRAIVTGDFNGDGRLDLAVATTIDDYLFGVVSYVVLLLGNGDGTFQTANQPIAVEGNIVALAAEDFNRDDRLDLAILTDENDEYGLPVSGSGEVTILLGNGDGTFQPPKIYAVDPPQVPFPQDGGSPAALVTGDFTGNGRIDLAVSEEYGSLGSFTQGWVSVLVNNGDGTFQPAQAVAAGANPSTLVTGDFDGDGHLDLGVVDQGDLNLAGGTGPGGVGILPGNGDGTFQPLEMVAPGFRPTLLVAGDLTGNGEFDLAGASASTGDVSVLLGNGDGTFERPVKVGTGSFPTSLIADDFTGDGRLDLSIANGGSNNVSILLSNADGTFVDPIQLATALHATPIVADVNQDGTGDLLVIDSAGDILYREGIPDQPGSFQPPITINPGFPSRDIAWVPNTDEGPVLASVDARDDAVSLYAFRDGGFVRVGKLATGSLPAQIIVADLSDHGLSDLVVRNPGDGTLSIYFGSTLLGDNSVVAVNPNFPAPTFLPPLILPVGLGVSDVQAIDTNGAGRLDLVVTNKLSGQVSILMNLGDRTFAPPAPYLAGAGLSEVDASSGLSEVSSLDATAGVASGAFTTGAPTSLLTITPGSDTIDILTGLGGGRYANPVTIGTPSPALAARVADFNHDGVPDVAVLSASGLSIYLGNGKGGFMPPVTYDTGPEPSGFTVADLNHDGNLDLLVGNAYGDVLVLIGNGDGSFNRYRQADQSIALAVADLTGKGSHDIIYADQGLDRVVVDYGADEPTVLADQSTGLLDPGAVALADLNGDDIPDLIVANSGSNNVLIYPGLGNGQFGAAVNGGHGYFVGTNPVGITVAYLTGSLPDLVVADEGSNEVSILINQGNFRFTPGPRLNSGGSGPVATLVGYFTGGKYPDLLVSNSGSNNVALLLGVGQGFFNDQHPTRFPVGTRPGPLFVGDFNGQEGLVTVNAGSNSVTLISAFNGTDPVTSTFSSGGLDPTTAFAFASSNGFDDLVVGNTGDGELVLLEGGPAGLMLTSSEVEPELTDPTALAFSALTGGQVQFYAAAAGSEAAELVALSLGIELGLGSQGVPEPVSGPAQLVPLHESSLPLVATVLTLTINVSGEELNLGPSDVEVAGVAAFLPGPGISVGQGLATQSRGADGDGSDEPEHADEARRAVAGKDSSASSAWERTVLGLDEALDRFQRENSRGLSGERRASAVGGRQEPPSRSTPARGPTTSPPASPDPRRRGDHAKEQAPSRGVGIPRVDAAIELLWGAQGEDHRPQRLCHAELLEYSLNRVVPVPQPSWPLVVPLALLAGAWLDLARGRRKVQAQSGSKDACIP
jgi:hypothetical protein